MGRFFENFHTTAYPSSLGWSEHGSSSSQGNAKLSKVLLIFIIIAGLSMCAYLNDLVHIFQLSTEESSIVYLRQDSTNDSDLNSQFSEEETSSFYLRQDSANDSDLSTADIGNNSVRKQDKTLASDIRLSHVELLGNAVNTHSDGGSPSSSSIAPRQTGQQESGRPSDLQPTSSDGLSTGIRSSTVESLGKAVNTHSVEGAPASFSITPPQSGQRESGRPDDLQSTLSGGLSTGLVPSADAPTMVAMDDTNCAHEVEDGQIYTINHSAMAPSWENLGLSIPDVEMFKSVEQQLVNAGGRRCRPQGQEQLVAFLFLTRGPMPFAPVWERFFHGHERFHTIYVHAHPDFRYNTSLNSSETRLFGDKLIRSEPVVIGSMSMMNAEKRLFAAALLNPYNDRFIVISEACVPVVDFPTVYRFLLSANVSFGLNKEEEWIVSYRYRLVLLPEVPFAVFRKGPQWISLTRRHAQIVATDRYYFYKFQLWCYDTINVQHEWCFPDEHYIHTMLNMLDAMNIVHDTIFHVSWRPGDTAHPRPYNTSEVNEELIMKTIRAGNCSAWNISQGACILFARKFMPDTLPLLLDLDDKLNLWRGKFT